MKKTFCDYMTSIGTVLNIKSAIAMGSYSIIFLRVCFFIKKKILQNAFFVLFSREVHRVVQKFLMNME